MDQLLARLAENEKAEREKEQTYDWMKAAHGKLVRQPIGKALKRPPMSACGLFYRPIKNEEAKEVQPQDEMHMVPLKGIEIKATLEGALATVNFDMTYSNPGDQAIECVYEYPLDAETIFSKLVV